ncbi:hypothetical protein MKQ68_22625 [Chitinophaga horti]|uniref:Por secretion system C-terminal sorting domain-containing protein n=1 Tax=Chitinophaga horti TaxID=2920382 RepID=A0ABY6J3J9_9BACT|nr:hypothetical protein [Chitinophaga horti]UYQ92879.1 hypothetical protein MKQ68_22625 [Chitinophaga horti]
MKNNLTCSFAPKKQIIMALIILGASYPTMAQSPVFAYNNTPVEKTSGGAKKAVKVNVVSEAENPLLFRVTINNTTGDRITMFIKDGNNNILHREVLDADPQITGRYNLQSLEDGAYYFEFRSGKSKVEKMVDIKTEVYSNRKVEIE